MPCQDNWKHRSVGMKCASCMWFVEKPVSAQIAVTAQPKELLPALGRCRRHAPIGGGAGWPAVFANDFCGDHKLDEEKL